MNILKKVTSLVLLMFMSLFAIAQNTAEQVNGDTDFMNSNGKIYVVVAVIVLIVIGLFLYLIFLDKKITKLEKEHDQL